MTMSRRLKMRIALVGGFAALSGGQPLFAQEEVRDLDGAASDIRAFSGTIGTGTQAFSITLQADSAFQVDVAPGPSSEIDPVLAVKDADTGEVLAEDDDSGGGLAARVYVFSETARRLRIEVSNFEDIGEGGTYELFVRRSDYRPAQPRAIGWGETLSGTLAGGSEHLFTIGGQADYQLDVRLDAAAGAELDPLLELYRGEGTGGEMVASNDDAEDGVNARLRHVFTDDAIYTIRATGFDGSEGDYLMTVAERRAPLKPLPPQAMGIGQTVDGTIGSGFADEAGGGPRQVSYRFDAASLAAIRGGAGEVTFEMIGSSELEGGLDPVLELGFDTPLGFTSVRTDDDGGNGLDARLAVDLAPLAEEAGWLERLELRASSLGEETGSYRLKVSAGLLPTIDEEDGPDEGGA